SEDDGIGHRSGLFENRDHSGDTRLLLANRDVDAVQRPIVFVAGGLCRFIETSLIDDGIDAYGRLARRTVTNDQFALATANRNHRVDRHDACLHGLSNWSSSNDAGSEFLDGIGRVTLHGSLAVQWLPQRIDDTPKETLADRYLQQLARSTNLVSFSELSVVT